jgi:hypothetical protein
MGLKLGDFSPAIGIATGKGAIGNLADKGLLGIGPRMIASKAQEKDEAKAREAVQAEADKAAAIQKEKKAAARENYLSASRVPTGGMEGYKATGFKSGGKVKSASARADGCAIKGKTKGAIR